MLPANPSTPASPGIVIDRAVYSQGSRRVGLDAPAVIRGLPLETKTWTALAVGSLVVAGLLSLSVVIGRLPVISHLIGDPLFFKRCLVVHVDLALVVWFYSFIAGLAGLRLSRKSGWLARVAIGLSIGGVLAILAGALVRGAQPVLSNYVPVIDHPLFLAGLAAFFAGVVVFIVHTFAASADATSNSPLSPDATTGFQAAGVAIILAAATWVAAQSGLPRGLETRIYYEFSFWGAGHVLQVANVAAMIAVWLWLLAKATGQPVLNPGGARVLFGILLAPHFVMPLLTFRGTLDNLYHSGATTLMRWAIFPVVIVAMGMGLRHLWRHRAGLKNADRSSLAHVARAGFLASVSLTAFGFILGALIRSSTTMVPAHYHASLGGVTVAFMAAAYLLCERAAAGSVLDRVWRSARTQLIGFGIGQFVFALGFAVGGAYGLGRKSYGAEQHVRSFGEIAGLCVMGIGGLMAAAFGIWFLFLVIREMRGWWSERVDASNLTQPATSP